MSTLKLEILNGEEENTVVDIALRRKKHERAIMDDLYAMQDDFNEGIDPDDFKTREIFDKHRKRQLCVMRKFTYRILLLAKIPDETWKSYIDNRNSAHT